MVFSLTDGDGKHAPIAMPIEHATYLVCETFAAMPNTDQILALVACTRRLVTQLTPDRRDNFIAALESLADRISTDLPRTS